jgi:1-acyl-sn-glycerol-3-phosphate acyltransferase
MLYRLLWPWMKALMRAAFAITGGFQREGRGNVPRTGGVLLCPNHVSDADPGAVAVALPRSAYFMAKEEIFSMPVMGRLVKLFHGFPIRRDTADRAALRHAENLLKSGQAVVIFPEGGGNAAGVLQPLYPGALLIALRTDVPVIPVAIRNTGSVWPHGATTPRRAGIAVTVTFGKPLDLGAIRGTRHAVDAGTRLLAETLAEMLGQPVPVGKPAARAAITPDDPTAPEKA